MSTSDISYNRLYNHYIEVVYHEENNISYTDFVYNTHST